MKIRESCEGVLTTAQNDAISGQWTVDSEPRNQPLVIVAQLSFQASLRAQVGSSALIVLKPAAWSKNEQRLIDLCAGAQRVIVVVTKWCR